MKDKGKWICTYKPCRLKRRCIIRNPALAAAGGKPTMCVIDDTDKNPDWDHPTVWRRIK